MPATAQAATNARRSLIAAFRSARNIATDLRHGEFTAAVPGRHGDTNNSDHKVLRAVFDQRVRPDDVIVDVGCGRGRVLAHLRSSPAMRPPFCPTMQRFCSFSTPSARPTSSGCGWRWRPGLRLSRPSAFSTRTVGTSADSSRAMRGRCGGKRLAGAAWSPSTTWL